MPAFVDDIVNQGIAIQFRKLHVTDVKESNENRKKESSEVTTLVIPIFNERWRMIMG
jgi:hypothetical protein